MTTSRSSLRDTRSDDLSLRRALGFQLANTAALAPAARIRDVLKAASDGNPRSHHAPANRLLYLASRCWSARRLRPFRAVGWAALESLIWTARTGGGAAARTRAQSAGREAGHRGRSRRLGITGLIPITVRGRVGAANPHAYPFCNGTASSVGSVRGAQKVSSVTTLADG